MSFPVVRPGMMALAACFLSSPAAAVPQQWERLGDWRVSPFGNDTCAALRDFGSGSRVFITSNAKGQGFLIITNAAWPMRRGQAYKVAVVLDGQRKTGSASGVEQDDRFGIGVPVGSRFVFNLAGGRTLELFDESGQTMERVDLAGVAAAVARMRGCVSEITGATGFAAPPAPPPPPLDG